MKLSNSELQRLYQEGTGAGARTEPCLDEETLRRAAACSLDDDERERAVDHLATCARCAETVKLLGSLEPWAAEAAQEMESAPSPHRFLGRRTTMWTAMGLAAVLILAVAVNHFLRQPPPPVLRGLPAQQIAAIPEDGAALSSAPETLSWPAGPEGATYRVTLYDVESTPLWRSAELSEASAILPEEARQALRPGQRYYWRVVETVQLDQRQYPLLSFTISSPSDSS